MNQLRTVHFYGPLKNITGLDSFQVAGNTIQQMFSVLKAAFGESFAQYVKDNNFQLYDKKYSKDGSVRDYGEDEIDKPLTDEMNEFHLYPHIAGSGKAGRIIAGIVLIVVGYIITGLSYGWAAPLGNAMIGAGVSLILGAIFAPRQQSQQDAPDERASYIFNNPVNTQAQGGPVPLIYGRFRAGTTVVSAGITSEQVAYYGSVGGNGGSAPDNIFFDRIQ